MRLARALACAALAFAATGALAHPPIRMLVPANPGGGWDETARALGRALIAARLVSSVQYDNKAGAGGTTGLAQFVNSSKADPNALMIGGQAMLAAVEVNRAAVKVQQATPVARLVAQYSVIVVAADSPYKTMADVIRALKANPAAVSWGAGSAGGTDHLLIGLIARAAGVDPGRINYTAFKGDSDAVPAIVGGQVKVGAWGYGEFAEHIRSGKMRALAVSGPAAMEGIPSLKEQGIDVVFGNWCGVWGAPGIAPAQRDALIAVVKASTETLEWRAALAKLGWTPAAITGDDFGKFVDAESRNAASLVDSMGLRK